PGRRRQQEEETGGQVEAQRAQRGQRREQVPQPERPEHEHDFEAPSPLAGEGRGGGVRGACMMRPLAAGMDTPSTPDLYGGGSVFHGHDGSVAGAISSSRTSTPGGW